MTNLAPVHRETAMVFLDDGLPLKEAQHRYHHRRQALLKQIQHLVVIYGHTLPLNQHNIWLNTNVPLFQNPDFLYLTGINQLNSILVLDPAAPHKEILFLPKKNPEREFWDGVRLGTGSQALNADITALTGFADIRDTADFNRFLIQRLWPDPKHKIGMIWHLDAKEAPIKDGYWHGHNRMAHLLRCHGFSTSRITNIEGLATAMRLRLDKVDIANLKTANHLSSTAFQSLVRQLPTLTTETAVCGQLAGECWKQTPFGWSFPPIIAGGKNATTLHYTANCAPLNPADLLLIDFGARWYAMPADVTRTVPISGRFSPLQRLMYTIVLDTQWYVETQVKPGLKLAEINERCWAYMHQRLQSEILDKGGQLTCVYDLSKGGHNVSHLIGHQVHDGDPSRKYRQFPLQPGWVISNEPGFYGRVEMSLDGTAYDEWIGIRIEDDLLITDSGYLNLTAECPKSINDIERLFV